MDGLLRLCATRAANLSDIQSRRSHPWLGAGPYLLLDASPDVGVDVLPVIERLLQHRAAHARQQGARDSLDEPLTLRIIEHVANQIARLAEVVVGAMQRVGAAHHVAVRFPAVIGRARRVGPRTTHLFGAYTGALPLCS
ncbi:hypothetical protein P3T21_007488 [Paraburkholderia sp. GAS334]